MPTIEDRLAELESHMEALTGALDSTTRSLQEAELRAVPIGSMEAYGGPLTADLIVKGWLPCDGSPLRSAEWPDLFAAIGRYWGTGSGTPNPAFNAESTLPADFNLPASAGQFLRGATGSPDADPGSRVPLGTGSNAEVGSRQSDQFASHGHGVNDPGHTHGYNWLTHTGGPDIAAGIHCARFDDHAYRTSSSGTGISIQSSGGPETRPKNINVNFIINAGRRVSL